MFGTEFERQQRELLAAGLIKILVELGGIVAAFYYFPRETAYWVLWFVLFIEIVSSVLADSFKYEIGVLKRKLWADTLTNRIFYELVFERFRDKELVDVDELFKEATRRAVADIKNFEADSEVPIRLGLTSKPSVLRSFVLQALGTALLFGAAAFVGSYLRGL